MFPECKSGNSIIEWKTLRKMAVTVKISFTVYQFWNYFKGFLISLKNLGKLSHEITAKSKKVTYFILNYSSEHTEKLYNLWMTF